MTFVKVLIFLCVIYLNNASAKPFNGVTELKNENQIAHINDRKKPDIPQYMEALYKASMEDENEDSELLHHGNVVRSYFDKETAQSETNNHQYFFDLSDINKVEETLTKAEVHLYKFPSIKRRQYRSVIQLNVEDIHTKDVVSSKIVNFRSHGWQIFPITRIVQNWLRNKRFNKGIRITVKFGDDQDTIFASKNSVRREPILVVYTKDRRDLTSGLLSRLKINNTLLQSNTNIEQAEGESNSVHQEGKKRVRRKALSKISKYPPCKVEKLEVPLDKIGWEQDFLKPASFVINQCVGTCRHDAAEVLKRTNHAIIQTLYATITDGTKASFPCCAPTKYKHTNALIHEQGVFKMVLLRKMTVTQCQCL